MTTTTAISALASIHPDAQIAPDVIIEPFATIQADVVIDSGSWIGSNAVIHNGARIGRNVKIFPGAVISSIPQDLKFTGEYTTVEIGDNAVIREYATVHRGTSYSKKTVVGENCLIMAYVHIAHDCNIGRNTVIANAVNLAGHIEIGEFAVIGGMCAMHQFSRIGKHTMIAGGTMIRKDVPPYTLAGRDPMSYVGINSRGLRRRGFTPERLNLIQEIYRVVFLSKLNISQALEKVEANFPPSPERDEILHFIRNSERGIMRGYTFME